MDGYEFGLPFWGVLEKPLEVFGSEGRFEVSEAEVLPICDNEYLIDVSLHLGGDVDFEEVGVEDDVEVFVTESIIRITVQRVRLLLLC